jgi:ferredoxin
MAITRRTLLQLATSGLAGAVVCGAAASFGGQNLVRPPGALHEPDFLARCVRCMRCVHVCQPLALRPGHWTDGLRNTGTPVMDVNKCIMCMECIRYCPTGALSRIPKAEVDIGRVIVVKEVCLAWRGARRCDACVKACPTKAFVLQDRRYPELIPEKCNGCAICIRRCPEPGSLLLTSEGAKRYDPQSGRILAQLEDRVGPYEIPPESYGEWFANRLRTLAEHYGLRSK